MQDVTIQRFRDGFAVVWHVNGKRRRYQLAAGTRKEAQAEALEVYRQKTFAARDKGATVTDIWESYVEDLGEKPTARSMRSTGRVVLPHFGPYLPDDVTKPLCLSYDAMRRKAGKSQGTVWTELGHLQSALNWAAKMRMIPHAPKVWRPSKPESDKRILTRDEASRLIDAAHAPHIRLTILLLLGTAARVGAILDLTWNRIDFDRGIINLRMEDAQTSKGRAVLPMSPGIRAALSTAHRAALSDYVVEYAAEPVASIRTGFVAAVRRSGIGHCRIHDLRHTAAVTMLQAGHPMDLVSQVLGHSNIATTSRVYGRYQPGYMQEAVNVLDFAQVRKTRG